MKILINTYLIIFTLFFCALASSQESQEPVQPPWFYFLPTEDPDNFNYSNLGISTIRGGNTSQRRSNIEVNKKVEPKEPKDAQSAQKLSTSTDVHIDDTANSFDSRPASSSNIYKWVDDQGVVHITNYIGSIPEKHWDQVKNY